MIELRNDSLVFSFPEVHESAVLRMDFQRTLRIPDDEKTYSLPPGLGRFPLQHVDDFAERVPDEWGRHGGVMFPMYQAEAMWIHFDPQWDTERRAAYPFAIKVATGKINALSGKEWAEGVHSAPQDYVVAPEQPWLDGYCVEEGGIRQFVAMPLASGYSVEEQIAGEANYGGLQVQVYPMKRDVFEERFPRVARSERFTYPSLDTCLEEPPTQYNMGLAPGGKMRQQVYTDPYAIRDWDTQTTSRCFVHIANAMLWRQYTGRNPPTTPPTAKEYTDAGLPWFEWYDEHNQLLPGAEKFLDLESAAQVGNEKRDAPLPENKSVKPEHIVHLRKGLTHNQVREWTG